MEVTLLRVHIPVRMSVSLDIIQFPLQNFTLLDISFDSIWHTQEEGKNN